MSPEEHAWLARQLFEAVGSNKKVAELLGFESEGHVSRFKDHRYGQFLNARQIDVLQQFKQVRIYSDGLSAAIDPPPVGDALKEASETTEAAALLQHRIRLVTSDGKRPTPRELDELAAQAAQTRREAEEACAAIERLRAAG